MATKNPENKQVNAMRAFGRALKDLDSKGLAWARAAVEEEIASRTTGQTPPPFDRAAGG